MSSQPIADHTETAILERLIAPHRDDLPAEAARFFLSIDFSQEDRRRMNSLAEKARAGDVGEQERAEIESYRHVSHLLALMQSKARKSLKRTQ